MKIQTLVFILLGMLVLSFGIGFISLGYNDGYHFSPIGFRHTPNTGENADSKTDFDIQGHKERVNFDPGRIEVDTGKEKVKIGFDGIKVNTGKEKVDIGFSGIKVNTGKEKVDIGFSGIDVDTGKERVNVGFDGIRVDDGKSNVKLTFGEGGFFRNLFRWIGFIDDTMIEENADEARNIDISSTEKIIVSSPVINILAVAEDRDDIFVHYHGYIKANHIPHLDIKEGRNLDIRLETPNPNIRVISDDALLEIRIPISYQGNFELTSASGNIIISNLQVVDLKVSTSSGDGKIKSIINANTNITTSSGDFSLDGISSNQLNLSSSSGNFNLTDSKGDISIDTSSGYIDIEGHGLNDMELNTSSGNIGIRLPINASYEIRARTSSGRFTTFPEMDSKVKDDRLLEATVGKGDKLININTSSGDVSFHQN